jgi:hypothetical protein
MPTYLVINEKLERKFQPNFCGDIEEWATFYY